MNDYIDRAALKKRFQKRLIWLEKDVHNEYSKGLFHGCETDMSLIDEIPAADVVEVRHGNWIWNAHHCKWECSECGGMEGECESPVCKWCGARMDKEEEHEAD